MPSETADTGPDRPSLTLQERLPDGTVAGDYVVTAFVAQGGCGSVYQARHRSLGREAAIKVLRSSLAAQPKVVERFAREVRVVNLLRHPNIVEIFDVGALPDGRPYYVMEYLRGRTLAELLSERGRLPPEEVLTLLVPICSALEAAHAAGVVHRDVKASNILVQEGEPPSVKLLDFGIAKLLVPTAGAAGLTSEGRQIGTPTIMAPEQLLGRAVDARTDIYALGILLYRILTGRLPFDAKRPLELAQQHIEEPAPRPSQRAPLPAALDAVVLRCLEKDAAHRYASVRDFLGALRLAIGDIGGAGDALSAAPVSGVAVYLDIRMRAEGDDLDEAMTDDISSILDLGEQMLSAEGFVLATVTGSQVLGVLPLPASRDEALEVRSSALEVAAELRRRIDARPGADRRVDVNVCVHAADVTFRRGDPLQVLGGPLVHVDEWAPRRPFAGLCGTRQALDGLTTFEVTEGPGPLLCVTKRR